MKQSRPAFRLFLPGAEMMLAASLHSTHENERQMLYEQLGRLSATDLLLLDRGYPCCWLPVVLGERGIAFCMRVEYTKSPDSNEHAEKSGFACVRQFLRSGETDQIVTLRAPDRRDATDYECAAVGHRAYVHTALKPLLPALLLGRRGAAKLLLTVLKLVAKNTCRHKEGLSKPRKSRPKPHKPMTQKAC